MTLPFSKHHQPQARNPNSSFTADAGNAPDQKAFRRNTLEPLGDGVHCYAYPIRAGAHGASIEKVNTSQGCVAQPAGNLYAPFVKPCPAILDIAMDCESLKMIRLAVKAVASKCSRNQLALLRSSASHSAFFR